jgi:hypothetical protein
MLGEVGDGVNRPIIKLQYLRGDYLLYLYVFFLLYFLYDFFLERYERFLRRVVRFMIKEVIVSRLLPPAGETIFSGKSYKGSIIGENGIFNNSRRLKSV